MTDPLKRQQFGLALAIVLSLLIAPSASGQDDVKALSQKTTDLIPTVSGSISRPWASPRDP